MAITRERRNILPFVLELSGLRGSQANHQSPSALKDSRNQRNRRTLSVQFEGKPPPTKGANGCSTPICSFYFTGDFPTPCHESVFLQEGVGEATKKDLTTWEMLAMVMLGPNEVLHQPLTGYVFLLLTPQHGFVFALVFFQNHPKRVPLQRNGPVFFGGWL